jgi:hypothetical protein
MALIEVNWNPARRQLRSFGVVCVIAFGAIGVWVYVRHGLFGVKLPAPAALTTALALWAVALLCCALTWLAPRALRPLYVLLTIISLPIGLVLSQVFLALLFYGVLTPIGLVMRLVGRDPLHRRFDRQTTSYWIRREPVRNVERYYRQF